MTNKTNGIDVSEYFIDVVDEGGGMIDYKILPNYERLLVEKIFEQNQQFKRLQEENEKLKEKNKSIAKDYVGVFGDYQKYKQALEEIKEISKQCMTKDLCSIDCDYADHCYIEDEEIPTYDICKLIIEKINEVLNDRN